MIHRSTSILRAACAVSALALFAYSAHAQTGYGVDASGNLFKFDVNNPNTTAVVIGPIGVGLVTEAIDFRPSSSTLYGIDVGANTIKLYTIDINTGAATVVGTASTSAASATTLPATKSSASTSIPPRSKVTAACGFVSSARITATSALIPPRV